MPKTKTAVKQTKTGASGSRKTIQEYLGVPNGVKFIERPRETLAGSARWCGARSRGRGRPVSGAPRWSSRDCCGP